MDFQLFERKFARLETRVKFSGAWKPWGRPARIFDPTHFTLDVSQDNYGEHFEVSVSPKTTLEVDAIDVQPKLRHLLLMVWRNPDKDKPGRKDKFLCGFDERHLFVAAVPGDNVSSVKTAIEALKPQLVKDAQDRMSLSGTARLRRRNRAFVRQGEWFFVPAPSLEVDPLLVLEKEPLSRGRGKSHFCQYAYRTGGDMVYVCRQYPAGVVEKEYHALLKQQTGANTWNWQRMMRNPELYVQGTVRHPDHATLRLNGWHRVVMNTENQAPAGKHVVFLD
jgi:hypothetical protein